MTGPTAPEPVVPEPSEPEPAEPVSSTGPARSTAGCGATCPGNRAARVTILVVAAAVVVVLLFGVVFPWVEPRLPFNQVTVGGADRPTASEPAICEDGRVTTQATGSAVRPRTDGGRPLRILVVDNYDSFVFNLVQYLAQLGRRAGGAAQRRRRAGRGGRSTTACCSRPGPGTPEEAGVCVDLVTHAAGRVPVLGVCLGHQAIGVAYGAKVGRAPELLHGKTSQVHHRAWACWPGCPTRSPRPATTRSRSRRRPSRTRSRSPGRPPAGS